MSSWLTIFDFGVAAVLVQLAILRQKLAFSVSLLVGSLAILALYAHFHFQISWTLLGKVAVNAGVPSVMAVAGNYLASALTESDQQRRAWRALFIALALFGLVVSLWLEIELDREHKSEIRGLRNDIGNDFMAQLVKYNQDHPQHQITLQEFSEIARGIKQVPPKAIDPYANFTNERFNEVTKLATADLGMQFGKWMSQQQTVRILAHDGITGWNRQHPQQPANEAAEMQKGEQLVREQDISTEANIKDVVLHACELRSEIFNNRLETSEKNQFLAQDQSTSVACSKVKSGNYSVTDAGQVFHCLTVLQKVLESHIAH